MMRNLLFLLLLFLSFGYLHAQSFNRTDSQGRKQGLWAKKYPQSSVLQYQGSFKDGKPEGVFRYNYPNNKLKALVEHIENSDRAKVEFYHENGQLMSKGMYKNMKKDSIWLSFNEKGQLTMLETYKNDVLHGEKKLYHVPTRTNDKTQVVISIYHYIDGLPDGKFVEYYPDGKLKKTGQFKDNQRDGSWVHYEANGNKMMEENYYEGKMHGWQIGYDNSGKQAEKKYYYHGEHLEGDRLKSVLNQLKQQGISPNGGKLSQNNEIK